MPKWPTRPARGLGPGGVALRGMVGGTRGRLARVETRAVAGFSLAALLSLWVLPGSLLTAEIVPLKIMASAILAGITIYAIRLDITFDVSELHIDTAKQETRVIARTNRSDVLREVYAVSEVSGLEVAGRTLHLRSADGRRHSIFPHAQSLTDTARAFPHTFC